MTGRHIMYTVITCLAIIAGAIVIINSDYNRRVIKAMDNNYCEGTIQGQPGTHWVKCQEVK